MAMLPGITELVMTDAEFDAAVDRDAANHPPHPDAMNAVCVWADGTHCARDDLADYLSFMSDDYELLPEYMML